MHVQFDLTLLWWCILILPIVREESPSRFIQHFEEA